MFFHAQFLTQLYLKCRFSFAFFFFCIYRTGTYTQLLWGQMTLVIGNDEDSLIETVSSSIIYDRILPSIREPQNLCQIPNLFNGLLLLYYIILLLYSYPTVCTVIKEHLTFTLFFTSGLFLNT